MRPTLKTFELLWMSLTNRLTSFSWVFLISEASFTLASSRQQLNFSVKITRNCAGFLNYSFWLIEITCTTLSVTNQILNWNQSRTGHSHWQELWTVCWLLLRVLIGPLWYFFVLIGRWDHLAFDFTTLSKKKRRTANQWRLRDNVPLQPVVLSFQSPSW